MPTMKGCFVLQRRFAYVGHELIKFLKEDGVADEFCGYVQLRDSYNFLASQTDIKYSALILDEDIQKKYKREPLDLEYLAEFEKQYGSVWKYIDIDRVIRHGQLVREYPFDASPYTHEDLLRIAQVYIKEITAFLDTQKPDFVFGYVFGSLGTLLVHDIAKKRGIPIFTAIVPSTRNMLTVSRSYERLTYVENTCLGNVSTRKLPKYEEARAFLEEFRHKPFVYNKMQVSKFGGRSSQFLFMHPRRLLRTLHFNTLRIFIDYWSDRERATDYTTVKPWNYFVDRIKRLARVLRGHSDLYDEYDTSKRFAFYPLQSEPEASLLLLAPDITDQVILIERIARALPAGMLLYVKEHPSMVPLRPRRYYKRIKAIPNARLMYPSISSFDLINKAELITTINGTVGWEALQLGKPVITFGSIFYNFFSFVGKGKGADNLPTLIQKQLDVKTDDEELIRYLAALFEDSASLDLMYLWEVETDEEKRRAGFKEFADVLARKIIAAHADAL